MNRPARTNRPTPTSRQEAQFLAGADQVAAALAALGEAGAVSLPLLAPGRRRQLLAAARHAAWRPARAIVGSGDSVVRQEMEVCSEFSGASPFRALARDFQALLEDATARLDDGHLGEGLLGNELFATALRFDDLVLQRYRTGALGITPHRDGLRYVNLAALFTLSGEARFCLCAKRDGAGAREIDAAPGTVILLRAPGFRGGIERPFHFVCDIRVRRYSFGLRQLGPGDAPETGRDRSGKGA